MTSLLDGFLETCADEDASALPQTWEGSKSDFSVYDADEVLRGPEVQPSGKQHLAGDGHGVAVPSTIIWLPMDAEHAPSTETAVQGQMAMLPGMMAVEVPLHLLGGMQAESCEPRALKAMRQSCCVYHLDQDGNDDCPVCLERMLSGQTAWRLPCLHQVHHSCARRYFGARGVKPLCPLCRSDVGGRISK